ncbi:MAG: NAD(P)H-dependent oxidoreductase [SAR324 cluster bacterium]|nr:NAD(P)H-dependent oxidoreductase [SAR324 cluster bacterium]MBL7035726.1 NAD(P)H-dependent oxidoreductase [SAR324 cluster bacterium]
MNKTIAVIGSSRRNGNTGKLIDLIAADLKIDVIDLTTKNISPYDYDHQNIGDDYLLLMDHLLKFENIIFVSPVYWYSMSAQMKIFIDRMSDLLALEELKDRGRKLRTKTGYVVSTSISEQVEDSFIDSFKNTFAYLGMNYGGFIHVDCKDGFKPESCRSDVEDFVNKFK